MPDSPIHIIINDIRKKYCGKKVSLFDLRIIEDKYKICSLVNTRNDHTAFIRITSYGLEGVVFEDLTFDYEGVILKSNDIHAYLFCLNKALYELAYGVILVDENKPLLNSYSTPTFNYDIIHDELSRLKERMDALESIVVNLKSKNGVQTSLFDFLDNNRK